MEGIGGRATHNPLRCARMMVPSPRMQATPPLKLPPQNPPAISRGRTKMGRRRRPSALFTLWQRTPCYAKTPKISPTP